MSRIAFIRSLLITTGIAVVTLSVIGYLFERTLSGSIGYPIALFIASLLLFVMAYLVGRNQRLWQAIIGIMVVILLFHAGGQLLATIDLIFTQQLWDTAMQQDDRLPYRLSANTFGHDANGFRNPAIPEQVDTVVLGDSQSWGFATSRWDIWTQHLANMTEQFIYNMSLPGYGPAQYWVLLDEALVFSPETIVVSLYLGNDLLDTYNAIYTEDQFTSFRDDVGDQFTSPSVQTVRQMIREDREIDNQLLDFRDAFYQRNYLSLLASLMKLAEWSYSADYEWALQFPEIGAIYEGEGARTIFTPERRLRVLDLESERIGLGLELTQLVLLDMLQKTREEGVALVVVLIPTKESVYAEAMQGAQQTTNEAYRTVVEMEAIVRQQLIDLGNAEGFAVIDVLPALQEAVAQNQQLYPANADGHPNAAGNRVIAAAIASQLGD